jgi:hypothetical protein
MEGNNAVKSKMNCVEVGSLILAVALPVSFYLGLNVTLDLSGRIIDILEANPHRYLGYIRDAFVYLILPPAVGLTFSIIGFVREIKSPTGIFDKWWLHLMVIGGFFFFWGLIQLRGTYRQYCEAIGWVGLYGPVDIAGPIQKVYLTVWAGNVLWAFAGVLFMLSPAFRCYAVKREKNVLTTIKFPFLCEKGVTTCLLGLKE